MQYGIKDWNPVVKAPHRISSGEGKRAAPKTPNGSGSSYHLGIDIAAPLGTPITAGLGGTVTLAGWINGYGNTVVVRSPDGTYVQYAHLQSINVRRGQQVPSGSLLGAMGSTGRSTGSHLDLIVVKDGMALTREGKAHAKAKPWLTDSGSKPASYREQGKEVKYTTEAQPTDVPTSTVDASPRLAALDILASSTIPTVQTPPAVDTTPLPVIDVNPTPELNTADNNLDYDLLSLPSEDTYTQKTPATPAVIDPTPALEVLAESQVPYADLAENLVQSQWASETEEAINRLFEHRDVAPIGKLPEGVEQYLNTLIGKQ